MLINRILYIILLWVIPAFSYSQEINQEDPDFNNIQKQATASQKKIMIIGCTEWCGPCKTLKNEQLKDSLLRNFVSKNFIIASYDMEKGFGITLAKKYGIVQYPTLIFLDHQGKMLYKIEGTFAKVEHLLEGLTKAAGTKEGLFAGVSDSFNLAFPPFYNIYFESKIKKKVQPSVIDAYLNNQTDLFSEVNWRVMQLYETAPRFDTFIYNNYPKFKKLYGPEASVKIYKILNKRFNDAASTKDTIQFQRLLSFMNANQFAEKNILERKLFFYGKTALNWPEYTNLLNRYMSAFDESLIGYCMDAYENKYLKELADTFLFWINKKLEKDPSSWLYLFKGLFLEAKQQQPQAEAMYQKAIEIADGTGKDIFRNRIKEMKKHLYNN